MPDVLYEEVIEVDERVVLLQDGCQLQRKDPKRVVTGVNTLYSLVFMYLFVKHLRFFKDHSHLQPRFWKKLGHVKCK